MRRQGRTIRPPPMLGYALLAAGLSTVALSPASAQQSEPSQNADALPNDRPEIIVTARRQAEPLQRVPVSVIALSAEDLEARSVTNLRTLQNFVPNLTFAPSQNVGEAAGNIFIRGIGQEDFGAAAEPGVGFYVDGVYLARTLGTIMNVIDVARIEVLRGPQGTLFGKNTIGGAINVITSQPRSTQEARFDVILGTDERIELRGVANSPLSDRLLARLSAGLVSRDGYLRRLEPTVPIPPLERANQAPVNLEREGDERSHAIRLQLRWLMGERLSADFTLDGSRRDNAQGATHLDALNPNAGIFPQLNRLIREGKLLGPELTGALVPVDLLESHATGRNSTNQTFWGLSAVVTHEFKIGALKFIGAYRGLQSHVGTETDGLYFDIAETDVGVRQRQLSGELQFNGKAGALTFATGLFFLDERSEISPSVSSLNRILFTCSCFFPPGAPSQITADERKLGNKSYAVFGQATYRITDKLSATVGTRYSHERKTIDGKAFRVDEHLRPTDVVVASGMNEGEWSPFTYRFGLEYQAAANVMVYGSLAKGYKSGGFNARSALNLPNLGFNEYKPEIALTYEAGLRSEWLNRKLRLNATLFHTDYEDIQLRQQGLVAGIFTTLIENAAKARIRGAEVELTAAPVDGLTLRGAYGHLDPKYLDVGQVRGLTLDSRFQRTPRHSFSASVHFETHLRFGTLELHGDYSYRSKEQFQILAALNDQKAYGLLGARVTFRTKDDRWAFALFGTNLTDERYRTAGRGTLINQSGLAYSSIGMPRQVGFQVEKRF